METGFRNKLQDAGALLAAIGTNVAFGFAGMRLGEYAAARISPESGWMQAHGGLLGAGIGVAAGHVAGRKVYALLARKGDETLEVEFNGTTATITARELLLLLKENAELKVIIRQNEEMIVKIGDALMDLRSLAESIGAEGRELMGEIRAETVKFSLMSRFDLPSGVSVDDEGVIFHLPGGERRKRSFAELRLDVEAAARAEEHACRQEAGGGVMSSAVQPSTPRRTVRMPDNRYEVVDAAGNVVGRSLRKGPAEALAKEHNERADGEGRLEPSSTGQPVCS